MYKGVFQGKQLVLSVADDKNCRFPVKIKILENISATAL